MNKNSTKKLVYGLVIILVASGAFFMKNTGTYQVTHVNDGDTIVVDMQGRAETIRFIGADTPETKDPRKPVQCFGPEASAHTHTLLAPGTRIKLVADPKVSDRDVYGRLLRYVYLTDGTLYQEHLLKAGFARAYIGFPFSKTKQFIAVEAQAKQAKIGLWGACATP